MNAPLRRLGLTCLIALAACGTTVPLQTANTPTSAQAGGLGLDTTDTPDGEPLPSAYPGSALTAGDPAQAPATSDVRAPSMTSRRSMPVAAGAPGVTNTTISIGLYTANGYGGLAASFGAEGQDTGDQQAMYRAIVAYVNARGGIAGRRIVPVFHDANIAAVTADPDTETQAACATFTQDNKVYAVGSLVGGIGDQLYECTSKSKVIVTTTGELTTPSLLRRFTNTLYQPADMNFVRVTSTNVDALHAHGWFGRTPKVGVIITDTAGSAEVVNVGLEPALARHRLTLADTVTVPEGTAGSGHYSAAILRLKADGITHVFTGPGVSSLLIMTEAESQDYHPSYAINSRQGPSQTLETNAPSAQLAHAAGIGWIPVMDISASHRRGILAPEERRCLSAVAPSGQSTTGDTARIAAVWACDQLFFLARVLSTATTMDLAGFCAAAESLGTSYASTSTYSTRFASNRLHDGADTYRLNAYNSRCSCFQYVTGPKRTS